jgi:hypothetical protein
MRPRRCLSTEPCAWPLSLAGGAKRYLKREHLIGLGEQALG